MAGIIWYIAISIEDAKCADLDAWTDCWVPDEFLFASYPLEKLG